MVRGDLALNRTVPLWVLPAAVIGVVVAVAAAGIVVGYKVFWETAEGPRRADTEVASWSAVVKRNPTDAGGWFDLGVAYIDAGRYQEAEAALNKALQLYGGRDKAPHLDYYFGVVYAKQGAKEKAEEYLKRAAAKFPDNPLPYDQLAQLYISMGRYDDAIKQLDHILKKIDPTLADVYELRGQAYEKKGDKSKAMDDYLKALSYDPSRQEARRGLQRLGGSAPDQSAQGVSGR